MVRSWLLAALVALILAASGCITTTNMTEGDARNDVPPQPVLKSDTTTWSETVAGPSVHPQESVVAGPWTFTAPDTVQSLRSSLVWEAEQNEFHLRITTPSGETLTRSDPGQNVTFTPVDLASGDYVFEVVASGLTVADSVRLTVSHTWLEHTTAPVEKSLEGNIQFTQEGNKWRATIVYSTEESGIDALTLDVDTFNGAIDVSSGSGPAKATLKAWARADSKERAAELVELVSVSLGIEGDRLTAHAEDRSERSGSESTGASVEVRAPGTVSGTVDTSNGAITLSDLTTTGLVADTSNGGITGALSASGDVTLDTSNGGIDLRFTPTQSLTLNVDTSNGGIDLDLAEGSDIGYRLEADTSNGRITADMEEASLSGEDDDQKTLETSGYTGRSIQVSGTVDTSNGNIHFDGA